MARHLLLQRCPAPRFYVSCCSPFRQCSLAPCSEHWAVFCVLDSRMVHCTIVTGLSYAVFPQVRLHLFIHRQRTKGDAMRCDARRAPTEVEARCAAVDCSPGPPAARPCWPPALAAALQAARPTGQVRRRGEGVGRLCRADLLATPVRKATVFCFVLFCFFSGHIIPWY